MNKSNDDDNAIVLSRVFDAPREKVWNAWTKAEQVAKWWGPTGFTTPVCKIDFRVGGKFLFCMRSPQGQDFWYGGEYQEIIENELIVCSDYMADENGNRISPKQSAERPEETILRLIFEDENGKTKVTLRHEGISSSDDRSRAESGWFQNLEGLSEYLSQ